jgi:hypothetical protein
LSDIIATVAASLIGLSVGNTACKVRHRTLSFLTEPRRCVTFRFLVVRQPERCKTGYKRANQLRRKREQSALGRLVKMVLIVYLERNQRDSKELRVKRDLP